MGSMDVKNIHGKNEVEPEAARPGEIEVTLQRITLGKSWTDRNYKSRVADQDDELDDTAVDELSHRTARGPRNEISKHKVPVVHFDPYCEGEKSMAKFRFFYRSGHKLKSFNFPNFQLRNGRVGLDEQRHQRDLKKDIDSLAAPSVKPKLLDGDAASASRDQSASFSAVPSGPFLFRMEHQQQVDTNFHEGISISGLTFRHRHSSQLSASSNPPPATSGTNTIERRPAPSSLRPADSRLLSDVGPDHGSDADDELGSDSTLQSLSNDDGSQILGVGRRDKRPRSPLERNKTSFKARRNAGVDVSESRHGN